jgi:signal transduction histidine kinase
MPWYGKRRAVEAGVLIAAALDVLLVSHASWDLSFVASCVAVLALPLRRRLPRTVLVITAFGLLTGYALIAAMVAMMEVATARRARWEIAAAVALVAVAYVVPWPITNWDSERLNTIVSDLLYGLLLGGGPAALGMLVRTRQELDLRLHQLAASQETEKRLHAQQVLAEDRARLAREMHDLVSHKVMVISAQAGGLSVAAGDPVSRRTAETIQGLASDTLHELRAMVGMLRDPVASHVSVTPGTLLADIERLVSGSGVGARLHLDVPDTPPDEEIQHAAYRIVQEALTNVAKHAPGAPTSVLVARARDMILVEVRNGRATEPASPGAASGGYGLIGLRERAAELGGRLEAWPVAGGFAVRAELPEHRSHQPLPLPLGSSTVSP